MRKVFFYTFWKCQKLEKFLGDMEKKGFRLVGVSLSYIFYFKESGPKDTRYVYVTSFPRNYGFLKYERMMRAEFNAAPVPTSNSGFMKLYRICDQSADLSDIFLNRQRCFVQVAANNLFVGFVLLTIPVAFLILSLMNSLLLAAVLFALLSILCLCLEIYYLYVLIWLWRKQSKK